MNITEFISRLKAYVEAHTPNYQEVDAETLLEMLFNVYTEFNGFDNQIIREDFNNLYAAMNGKPSGKWTRSSTRSVPSAEITKRLDFRKVLKWASDWQ